MALPDGSKRAITVALGAVTVVAVGLVGSASGQQARNASPPSNSSVTVDLSVLDELGPTAAGKTAPDGMNRRGAVPSDKPGRRILLTPPPVKPRIRPGGRSVGAPSKQPGPAARRVPPPVPRAKPRRPVVVAVEPATEKKPSSPVVPKKRSEKAATRNTEHAKVAPPSIPKPVPVTAKAKAPDASEQTAKPATAAASKTIDAAPQTPPEPPEAPLTSRQVAAIGAPMSLLEPPKPKAASENDEEPAASTARAPVESPAPRVSDKSNPARPLPAPEPPAIIAMASEVSDESNRAQPDLSKGASPKAVASDGAPAAAAPRPAVGLQQAALPVTGPATSDSGGTVRLAFQSDRRALNATAREKIERVAARLKKDSRLRLQLLAYANGQSRSTREARRLSLYRALAVRSHLIKQGVRSTRIDVRALGDKFEKGPPDRVDLMLFAR